MNNKESLLNKLKRNALPLSSPKTTSKCNLSQCGSLLHPRRKSPYKVHFTKTTLTFYDKYLRVEAGLCTQCSLAYFASFLSIDSVYLRFVMSINEDYSGFTYQNEYLVKKYYSIIKCEIELFE
ncbi:Hypothetical_protein [Hexamita inflata]|uniref:Hypothetical_protein n=1 Tax=Hexamita inflata TaxID=28002 RepID=A0AA86NDC0_9EUKA|nr:Hypothetical protein HINF_LOCUS4656 [Hexamita inflata]